MRPVIQDTIASGKKVVFITFTIKDMDNLSENINLLNNSFRYLIHDNKNTAKIFKKIFCGGIRSLEIKKGENSKMWHSHFHCLFVKSTNSPFKQDYDFLKTSWELITSKLAKCKNKVGSVDYKAIKINKDLDNACGCILECFKYMTKLNWDLDNDVVELVQSIKGKRAINSFGIFRKMLSEVDNNLNNEYLIDVVDKKCSTCGNDNFIIVPHTNLKFNNLNDLIINEEVLYERFKG